MILLALVALALLTSLILGGSLAQLGQVRFKHSYLILLAMVIQIVVFSDRWQQSVPSVGLSDALYILSLIILGVALWINRKVPGVVLLGVGLICNASVIMANGGHMPATLSALSTAGIASTQAEFESLRLTNSSLVMPGTLLWFLGDVFAVPAALPLANVFSVGDVLIAIGGVWFVFAATRPARESRSLPVQPS